MFCTTHCKLTTVTCRSVKEFRFWWVNFGVYSQNYFHEKYKPAIRLFYLNWYRIKVDYHRSIPIRLNTCTPAVMNYDSWFKIISKKYNLYEFWLKKKTKNKNCCVSTNIHNFREVKQKINNIFFLYFQRTQRNIQITIPLQAYQHIEQEGFIFHYQLNYIFSKESTAPN